jgi:hypothetical protein
MDDKIGNYGFYTNRFVEANDLEDAEIKAVQLIRKREDAKTAILNKPDDPPMLYAEEIVEIENFDGIKSVEQGLIWHSEDQEEQ